MGPIYIETLYISSHMGPLYIETPCIYVYNQLKNFKTIHL